MAVVKLSRDGRTYSISMADLNNPYGYIEFIVTPNQLSWLEEHVTLGHVSLWRNSANRKYQIALCRKAFMFDGKQIPKNSIIVLDRADMLWVCSSFAFTVKVNKEGKRKRCMLPKKHLKYMYVSCYCMDTCMWEDMAIGRGSLMFNIHDAIAEIGVNHVEYNKSLYEIPDAVYVKMMKDCIRRKKNDNGGRAWDNPYAIIGNLVHRGYSDESHWTGMVGSMIANNLRYSCQ